ncbi:MaoC family dehydratase [Pseudooceanicola sp. MF1-13]|uniref:MaoC family dehydratase n=1 Tax=Pseudooceanicola sp. MF1-13 TaxID=3379095 RepID=UPI0038916498
MTKEIVADLKARAKLWPRGNRYEDFSEGRSFTHHWGRTVTEADNTLFTTLTMNYNPQYFNAEIAKENGHDRGCPVNPLLVFNTVFGLSVEDLSEGGGPFLGVDKCVYGVPVYPGDTLSASSKVLSARESGKRPDFGIVTWATVGLNQRGEEVIRFERSNLVRKRQSEEQV